MPDPRKALALAAKTPCDIRTAGAFLEGRPVRGNILKARLSEAARELGVEPCAPPAEPASQPPSAA